MVREKEGRGSGESVFVHDALTSVSESGRAKV